MAELKIVEPIGQSENQPTIGESGQESTGGAQTQKAADSGPLVFLADIIDDMEQTRIRNSNRLFALKSDPNKFGAIDPRSLAALTGAVDQSAASEKMLVKELEMAMAAHPLGPFVKSQLGLGLKTVARFIGGVGDIYWHPKHDRPRRLGELWALCGLHVVNGVAPSRTKGMQSNWNDNLRKRAFIMATGCVKQLKSPYRAVYDDAREKHANAVHAQPCRRCGPSGKPAEAGSELSDGHKHARAMRAVMKAIIKDLWLESKRVAELRAI